MSWGAIGVVDYIFGSRANTAHRGVGGQVITSKVALTETTNKSINLDTQLQPIKS